MLPRWHILLGTVFTILIWIFSPQINLFYLAIIFFSSFLIDFDHYAASVIKTKKLGLKDSFRYHEKLNIQEKKEIAKGIKKKSDFHLFHTIEFHLLIGLLGLLWVGFFYVFLGMIFHSTLDIFSMAREGSIHRREYFFFNWLSRKI